MLSMWNIYIRVGRFKKFNQLVWFEILEAVMDQEHDFCAEAGVWAKLSAKGGCSLIQVKWKFCGRVHEV